MLESCATLNNLLIAVRVLFRPQKSLNGQAERFLASLHFEQRGKLDQLSLEIC